MSLSQVGGRAGQGRVWRHRFQIASPRAVRQCDVGSQCCEGLINQSNERGAALSDECAARPRLSLRNILLWGPGLGWLRGRRTTRRPPPASAGLGCERAAGAHQAGAGNNDTWHCARHRAPSSPLHQPAPSRSRPPELSCLRTPAHHRWRRLRKAVRRSSVRIADGKKSAKRGSKQ